MNLRRKYPSDRDRQRGNTLVLVSASLVVLLGMAGLAIDLVSLYVARSEAQRAADAAALAGARVFVTSGCTSTGGCVSGGPQEIPAREQAIIAGSQNSVGGQSPKIVDSDVKFDYPTLENPTITVTVARDVTHGNPVPTTFMRVFGITERSVSASATAEAFNPSGSNIPVAAQCLKPWLLPNCDFAHLVPLADPTANHNCPNGDVTPPTLYASYYVDPVTGDILRDSPVSSGGVIGERVTIKYGEPTDAPVSSKYYPVFLPVGAVASFCPDQSQSWCKGGGDGTSGGDPSAALYRQNIECCNQNPITCGDKIVKPITGNKVGPTAQGVDCLIHEGNNGTGQDTIKITDSMPFPMTAGKNNPYFPKDFSPLPTSDSVVTIPIYDGALLCPGMKSCPDTVTVKVVGFMQVFIEDEDPKDMGTVHVYIVNIGGCGGGAGGVSDPGDGSGGGAGTISVGGASPIPVRLIHK